MTLAQWNTVLGVNLTGQFLCARAAVREFMRRGVQPQVSCSAGKIMCISSVHEVIPWAGHVNYAASKGGVMLMMKSLAQEVAPYRIRVNSICPGAIRTPINMQAWDTAEAYRELMKLIPYKRIGEAGGDRPRRGLAGLGLRRLRARHQSVRRWRHDALSGLRDRRLSMRPFLRRYRSSVELGERLLRALVWPTLDLILRLWLSGLFFASALVKLANWQTALYLAANEYPVDWMSPVTAAYVGVSIELLGAILLALGLMTRYAAMAMLALTLVIQLDYLALERQLFWLALFAWYALIGAGPLSLDQLLRRGLADSALPWVPRVIASSSWVRAHLGPIYLSAMRLWLGLTLLVSSVGSPAQGVLAAWLPPQALSMLPRTVALIGGLLLLGGLATRYAAALLLLALTAGTMMGMAGADQAYAAALLAMLLIHGAGAISIDRLVDTVLARHFPDPLSRASFSPEGLPRIVIVGAGFGGMACAAALRHVEVSITLIDRANHHLFQPLLYQVATAALSPGDIAVPVRTQFRDAYHVRVLLATVTAIDPRERRVLVGDRAIAYDYLVIATGASHSYFGKDNWAPFAPGLKRIEDATEIRRRILSAFERAEATEDAGERDALLTFLIVGGGPTGVELAGAIAELARFGMDQDFRRFDPSRARILLVQSASRLLPSFAPALSAQARRSLERLGVQVLLGSRVEQIDAEGVGVSGTRIAARTVLWAAGVTASPAATWLNAEADASGRVKAAADLSVPGLSNVFVVGDTALCNAWRGQPIPGLAPAAKQGGAYVGHLIRRQIEGRAPPPAFAYRHRGSLATIGRKAAVADFGIVRLWGAPAWWLWGVVHVGLLLGVRNRMSILVNWFWAYLTYGGGIRLITGADATIKSVPPGTMISR